MRRRTFLIATAVLLFVSSAPAQKSPGDYLAFVGSYTHPTSTTTSASKGIYAFRFDSKSGTLLPLGIAAEYRPRKAEHGVLYRVIDEHLETFLDAAAHTPRSGRRPSRTPIASRTRCIESW